MLTNNRIRKIVNVIVVAFGLIHVNLKPTPSQAKKSKGGPPFPLCSLCRWMPEASEKHWFKAYKP